VEKSFKVVRDRLRILTTHETGSEAFGKGNYIFAARQPMWIQTLIKAHIFDDGNRHIQKRKEPHAKITDPVRSHQYLMVRSSAMYFLDDAEIHKTP
jgi:hypothetical protein